MTQIPVSPQHGSTSSDADRLIRGLIPEKTAESRRMRYRYIETRFAQFADPVSALQNPEQAMAWARQLLDDSQYRPAIELLELSIEEAPRHKQVYLFLMEVLFLEGDALRFMRVLERFQRHFNDDAADSVLRVMARELAPGDPAWHAATGPLDLQGWSLPPAAKRNRAAQQKLHDALVQAMTYHLSR